jgi:hypothetical protein
MTDSELLNGVINNNPNCVKKFIDEYEKYFIRMLLKQFNKQIDYDLAQDYFYLYISELIDKKTEISITTKLSTFIGGVAYKKGLHHVSDRWTKHIVTTDDYETYDNLRTSFTDLFDIDNNRNFLYKKAKEILSKSELKLIELIEMGYDTKTIIKKVGLANANSLKSQKYKIIKKIKNQVKYLETFYKEKNIII